jgi:hypothetical protein
MPATRTLCRSRRAFTTVELVLALVLGGLVAAAVANVLRRQQRFFTSAAVVVEQRVSLRDATGILPGELRALAPVAGDVGAFSDSAVDIRATIGAAIACDTVAGGGAIDLAPVRPVGVPPLTSFTMMPQAGDVALVYDAGSPRDASDDVWLSLDVTDVTSLTTACAASPLLTLADAKAPRMQLRFAASARVAPSVRPGAYVRVLRRVRYRFYRASTGDWYLGYSEWDGTAFSVVQPVSGPFASYSRRGGSGLTLRYVDAQGAPLTLQADASRIARIDIVVRGAVRESLAGRSVALSDSQAVSVAVRNR